MTASLSGEKNIRVAIISDAIFQRNGVGSYYSDLADQLLKHGHEVSLICPHGEGCFNCGWIKFRMPGDATQKIYVPNLRNSIKRLADFNPQTVIIPTPGPFGMLGFAWAKRKKVPVISGFHTDFTSLSDMYFSRVTGGCSKAYLKYSHKILFRYSSMVLTTSQDMVPIAMQLGAKEADIMGTLLPENYVSTPPAPLSRNLKKVIFVGRLAPEKNISTVLTAAQEMVDVEFTIAGDGPLRAEIEDKADELANLSFVGWQSRDELLGLLDEHDLLVLPSFVESFGTVALEAMSRGRLVIVSEHCGLLDWPELAEHVFTMKEDEPLSQLVAKVANLPYQVRKEKAEAGRRAALSLHSWSFEHWSEVIVRGVEPNGVS